MRTSRKRSSEEGDTYFMPMTDMMVGLLFVFIIMLAYFATQIGKDLKAPEKEVIVPPYSWDVELEVVPYSKYERLHALYIDVLKTRNRLQLLLHEASKDRNKARAFLKAEKENFYHLELKGEVAELRGENKTVTISNNLLRANLEKLREKFKKIGTILDGPSWEFFFKLEAQKQCILSTIKSLLQKEGIRVEINLEQGLISIPASLLFDQGKTTFEGRPAAEKAIAALGVALVKVLPSFTNHDEGRRVGPGPELAAPTMPLGSFPDQADPNHVSDVRQIQEGKMNLEGQPNVEFECTPAGVNIEAVLIEGHADSDPIENEPSLKDLLDPDGQPVLAVSAYGSMRPIDKARTKEAKEKNRRIDLRILMHVPDADKIEELRSEIKEINREKKAQ